MIPGHAFRVDHVAEKLYAILDGERTKNDAYVILVSAITCRANLFRKSLTTQPRTLKDPYT